jgi:hypothetical protein
LLHGVLKGSSPFQQILQDKNVLEQHITLYLTERFLPNASQLTPQSGGLPGFDRLQKLKSYVNFAKS